MTIRHLHFRRNLFDADLHRVLTAGAERAAPRHIQKVDGRTGNGNQLFTDSVHIGNGAQKALRIFVMRTIENIFRRTSLTYASAVQ